MKIKGKISLFICLAIAVLPLLSSAGTVEIHQDQLWVDGTAQPELYGAELQYFRLRGGDGPNIPREKVIALWNAALDRMVEAKMNAISFYIPWDFHEYAEGKFDFTGSVDEDGDGNPDYPSRDLVTFFRLVQEHGIQHILVRPGPYINAEWGFMGFGAVPMWFHEKFPDSHLQTPAGLNTKLYDYHDPDFLRATHRWLAELYKQVLVHYIGPGKPVDFIQLDNETNFQWQSIYAGDYGPLTTSRYQKALERYYGSLDAVNALYGTQWSSWEEVSPPTKPGVNLLQDQDWYRFQDESIHDYLGVIRDMWREIGVDEPDVLFTLAESYNATAGGLLPNYAYRNDPGVTGMMTVNMYPKTYEAPNHSLLNLPFKADHDVKAATSANQHYTGKKDQWTMGPEIQGGWWNGTDVTDDARWQTYLTTLGHGLKALFVYYFNEGQNWDGTWQRDQAQAQYDLLKNSPSYQSIPDGSLPQSFWKQLQSSVDKNVIVGIDARFQLQQDPSLLNELHFNASLDGNAQPSEHFEVLKELGNKITGPYGEFLGKAIEMTDPVCILKDVAEHAPSGIAGLDSISMNADWTGSLVGYLLQAGVNARIVHWGINPEETLNSCKLVVYQGNGLQSPGLARKLRSLIRGGRTVLSLLDDTLSKRMGLSIAQSSGAQKVRPMLDFDGEKFDAAPAPFFTYDLSQAENCETWLQSSSGISGYRCRIGRGNLVHLGALFYDGINSDRYAQLADLPSRLAPLRKILTELGIRSRVRIVEDGGRLVAFGRKLRSRRSPLWVTVKNGRESAVDFHVALESVEWGARYRVTDLRLGSTQELSGSELKKAGLPAHLESGGSTVFWVERI